MTPPPCRVRATEKNGHIVLLRLKDTHSLLPVFIGEFECGALVSQINKKPTVRLWLALLRCASQQQFRPPPMQLHHPGLAKS